MKNTFSSSEVEKASSVIEGFQPEISIVPSKAPVHVVYGGAHLFKHDTPQKLGRLALKSLDEHAPDFAEFSRAMWLKGADELPPFPDLAAQLERRLSESAETVKKENHAAWFAWTIYRRTIEKLQEQAVEDFRIDFEDGYGFRLDEEEDAHALSASEELAKSFLEQTITPFCGFRVKAFQPETFRRAVRTLDFFLTNLVEKIGGRLPDNFVVTLPKISRPEEVAALCELLSFFEKRSGLEEKSIKIEIMIETPRAIFSEAGETVPAKLVRAADGRCTAAHFGAYDYTSFFGIVAEHQHLRHEACNFARQIMQTSLAPLGIRLSDSVTTEMPVPVYKGENLSEKQTVENRRAVHKAWRAHFVNVTHSLINGFYQSWDLHPAQLVARYAALYAFFLESEESSAKRLRGFIEKATQAMLTGNQFDDAASAQGLLNFFVRARRSGAMTDEEVRQATGLTSEELERASFPEIMANRRKKQSV